LRFRKNQREKYNSVIVLSILWFQYITLYLFFVDFSSAV